MYWDSGENAQPVNDGRCCLKCNDTFVIPARLADMFGRRDPEQPPTNLNVAQNFWREVTSERVPFGEVPSSIAKAEEE